MTPVLCFTLVLAAQEAPPPPLLDPPPVEEPAEIPPPDEKAPAREKARAAPAPPPPVVDNAPPLPRPLLGAAAGAGGAALGAAAGGAVLLLATFAPIDPGLITYLVLFFSPTVPTLAALGAGSGVLLLAFEGASGREWSDMIGCSLVGCSCLGGLVGLPIGFGCNFNLCSPRSWMEGPGRLLVMAPSAGAGLGAAAGAIAGGFSAVSTGNGDLRTLIVLAGLGASAGGLLGGGVGGLIAGFRE
jgi:hypothetical protein